jgi:hypothetical protein
MANKFLDRTGVEWLLNQINTKLSESEVNALINEALVDFKVNLVTIVDSLPETGEEGTLYLMPDDSGVAFYTYTWENGAFKSMGKDKITIDFANYYTKSEVDNTFVKQADLQPLTVEELEALLV